MTEYTAMTGRKILCMGPFCWGEGKTSQEAIKNAKKNRVKIYEGKAGWRYILFDCAEDVTVDGMGSLCYIPKDGVVPYIELERSKGMQKQKESV